MRIILEGPDCSGKTTLGKYLLTQLNNYKYIHNSLDENKNFCWRNIDRKIIATSETLYYSHVNSLKHHKDVIVDRLWPSEFVYGNLFRSKIEYNIKELKQEIEKYKPVYIGCLPPKHLVQKYFKRRLNENDEDFDTVSNVYDMYEFLFDVCKEFMIFDYEIETVEQFTRRFIDEHKHSMEKINYRSN